MKTVVLEMRLRLVRDALGVLSWEVVEEPPAAVPPGSFPPDAFSNETLFPDTSFPETPFPGDVTTYLTKPGGGVSALVVQLESEFDSLLRAQAMRWRPDE